MQRYLSARVASKGVIVRDGRLLLLRRRDDLDLWPGMWDLPGGGVGRGGTIELTLVRAVRAETGYNARVGLPVHVSSEVVRVRNEKSFLSIVSCFVCTTRSRAPPKLDLGEHCDFAWVTRKELRRLNAVPRLRPAMEMAFAE